MTQVGNLLMSGRILCVNQGCAVVESTLVIPPIWFNAVGAVYFFTVLFAGMVTRHKNHGDISIVLLRVLLLCGISAEGVLVSYQIFVVQTFCSYCLFICALILCMNVLVGWRQTFCALLTFSTVVTVFSLLQFQNPVRGVAASGLDQGTYALKNGSSAQRSFYLLFSEECPHCHRVMEMLDSSDARCEVRYNPIKEMRAEGLPFAHMTATASYDPAINMSLLKVLGLKTVPILIEKSSGNVRFISGGDAIAEYLKRYCFTQKENKPISGGLQSLFQESNNQDECKVDTDCGSAPVDQSLEQSL